jgi:hypothetical protein
VTPLELKPLRPAWDASEPEPWALVSPREDESCRWQSGDGRWVAISIGTGDDLGTIVVSDSRGRRQRVDNYEFALALARSWRV